MSGRLEFVNPEALGAPRGYSNGVVAPAGSRLLFVAGQVGWDATQCIVDTGFVEQFERALVNVLTVVTGAGGSAADIVRLTIYVTDRSLYTSDLKRIGETYRRQMGRHYPAMALVEVAALLELGALVEIEATAALAPS